MDDQHRRHDRERHPEQHGAPVVHPGSDHRQAQRGHRRQRAGRADDDHVDPGATMTWRSAVAASRPAGTSAAAAATARTGIACATEDRRCDVSKCVTWAVDRSTENAPPRPRRRRANHGGTPHRRRSSPRSLPDAMLAITRHPHQPRRDELSATWHAGAPDEARPPGDAVGRRPHSPDVSDSLAAGAPRGRTSSAAVVSRVVTETLARWRKR